MSGELKVKLKDTHSNRHYNLFKSLKI